MGLARDTAELEERAAAQEREVAKVADADDADKKAVLQAMRQFGESDWDAEAKGDFGGGLGDNSNFNKANVKDIMAATRAKMAAEHEARQAKSKAAEKADKLKRAEAKKKAQERSKANESRRGGRSM